MTNKNFIRSKVGLLSQKISVDQASACFFFTLSLVYTLIAFAWQPIELLFPQSMHGDILLYTLEIEASDPVGSTFMPKVYGLFGMFFSVLLGLRATLKQRSGQTEQTETFASLCSTLSWKGFVQVLLLISLMVFYAETLRGLGFILSSGLFLMGGFIVLGERRIKVLLLATWPLTIAFSVLLNQVLGLNIGLGTWVLPLLGA